MMGRPGLGVLDKAVSIQQSHGLTEDGKTVAPSPHLEKAISLVASPTLVPFPWQHMLRCEFRRLIHVARQSTCKGP